MNTKQDNLKTLIKKYLSIKSVYIPDSSFIGNNTSFYDNPIYIFYRDIEIAFYSLSKKEQFVFENEFLSPHPSNWWKPYFSKQEFIELKNSGQKKFMEKFYEIH